PPTRGFGAPPECVPTKPMLEFSGVRATVPDAIGTETGGASAAPGDAAGAGGLDPLPGRPALPAAVADGPAVVPPAPSSVPSVHPRTNKLAAISRLDEKRTITSIPPSFDDRTRASRR